jgi:hypothetical protein
VTDDLVVDARPAVCWLDAFPWVEAAVSRTGWLDGEVEAWWLEPIDTPGTLQRPLRIARISGLALQHLTRWMIGQILPGLRAETVLAHLEMSARARNALGQARYRLAGDLQNLELGDLLDLPNVGIGTVDSVLKALADSSTSQGTPVLLPPQAEDRRPVESWGGTLLEDLRLIASWHVALGVPDQPLLNGALAVGAPHEVIKAKQRLELISPGDVLDADQAELDVAELMHRSISTLDRRAQQVVARRFFADEPETLDELGRLLGITRERVRQIEAKARANMVSFLENTDTLFKGASGDGLEMVAEAVRELIGIVLPLDDLIALIPALARSVEAVGQPAWRVLDRLDDAYEIEDGWCASPTILAAQTMTVTRLHELANHHGVVAVDDLEAFNPNQSLEAGRESLRAWLAYCGYALDGEYVFTRIGSVSDRAAAILSVVGSPMVSQDLLDRLGVERTLGSLKNAVAADERFERVDRDRWALAEWGMESYGGVRALVRDEVARGGGRVALDALIGHITGKYSVAASSVVAYASSPPFEVKNGIVRMGTEGREVRKGPQRTRRLYRRADGWLYRVKVTKDHARGTGSVAPVAIAGILDLQYGQTRRLESVLGPQWISWTSTQPIFGTFRRFLIAQDLEVGSEIFLVIADDGTFHIEPVDITYANPLEQALALAGVSDAAMRQRPRVALATAIGLAEDSSPASVIGGYRERGDSDIAELLLTVRDRLDDVVRSPAPPPVDIDEILDLL